MGLHADMQPAFEPYTEREAFIASTLGDKYQFIKRIGEGGSKATVYAVVNKSLDRIEALKVLPDDLMRDKEFFERFKVEAKICASFAHPNIVTIYDYEKLEKFYFFSMLFVDGPTLTKFTKPPNSMSIRCICRNIATICDAIHYAHQQGVIHRDIKASNIMLDQSGKPYVTDFGIAKWERSLTRTQTGVLMGSPHYMSPEQIEGDELDCRSDIYSLGVTLYVLLTHRYPFHGETAMSIFAKRLSQAPTPPEAYNPKLSPRLIQILSKTLQPDRRNRFQTATELSDALNDFIQTGKGAATTGASGRSPGHERMVPEPFFSGKMQHMAMVTILVIALTVPFLLIPKEKNSPTAAHVAASEALRNKTEKRFTVPPLPEPTQMPNAANKSTLTLTDVNEENEQQARVVQTHEVITKLLVDLKAEYEAGGFKKSIRMAEDGLRRISQISPENQQQFNNARKKLRAYIDTADAELTKSAESARKNIEKKKRQQADKQEFLKKMNSLSQSFKKKWSQGDYKGCLTTVDIALKKLKQQPRDQQSAFSDLKNEINRYRTMAMEKLSEQRHDQELNHLVTVVEQHFKNGGYAQCIDAASVAKATLGSLPANQKRRYAYIEKKVDFYQAMAKNAKMNKERQLAVLDRIEKKRILGDLEEAISLIDALLIQSNLAPGIEEALRSKRKEIDRERE